MKTLFRNAWPYVAIAAIFYTLTSVNFSETLSEEEQLEINHQLEQAQQIELAEQSP